MYEIYGLVTDRPISPAELSGALRSAGMVREAGSASGLDWRGLVRHLVTITPQGNVTTDRDRTFADFAAPVSVLAPSASQVSYTSRPYRGFLF